jgi:hypothetical protein
VKDGRRRARRAGILARVSAASQQLRSRLRLLLGLTGPIGAGLLLAGCGHVVDDKKLEDQITANLEHQTGVRIVSAVCPTDVDVDPGRRFDCLVTAGDGSRARVMVRIRNNEADVTILGVAAAK